MNEQVIKAKLSRGTFLVLRYFLLFGLTFVILYPIVFKLSSMFMSGMDLYNPVVKYIPLNPTFENVKTVINETKYFLSLFNSTWISLACAGSQTFICAFVGYGLAKYRFVGHKVVFALVIFSLIVPTQALSFSLFSYFRFVNPLNILSFFGISAPSLIDTPFPLLILSVTGIAFKNGLYIMLFYQFFKGVPTELSEAAEVDGAGEFKTYFKIIMPMVIPLGVTVFMLAFAWQFTDGIYSSLFFSQMAVVPNSVLKAGSILGSHAIGGKIAATYTNTASFLLILPILILYIFLQRFLIQGIERSGIVG